MTKPTAFTYALPIGLALFAGACFGDLASGVLSEPNGLDPSATEAMSTTGDTGSSTDDAGTSTGLTTSDGSEATTEESATDGTTADTTTTDPIVPPTIENVSITPNPAFANGAVAITVMTSDTEGVTMELDDDSAVELVAIDGGIFEGEIR